MGATSPSWGKMSKRSNAPHASSDMLAMPAPVRTSSSRLGKQGPSSLSGTPRLGTPRSLKPRARRRTLLCLQAAIVIIFGMVLVKQALKLSAIAPYASSSASGKGQYISDQSVLGGEEEEGVLEEDPQLREEQDEEEEEEEDLHQGEDYVEGVAQGLQWQDLPRLPGEHGGGAADMISMLPSDSRLSSVLAHPTGGPLGRRTQYLYRFTNVRLADGGIEFFGGPGLRQPKRPRWYDVVRANSSNPRPPTTLVLPTGATSEAGSVHIPVRYLPTLRPENACKRWIEAPAALLHVRQPESMWRTWTEGLAPTFQTLRELGYLHLMDIDSAGGVKEVADGVPLGECPLVYDPALRESRPADECTHAGSLVAGAVRVCDGNDTTSPWCLPGVWQHVNSSLRPVLLYRSPAVMDNDWAALYSAMAGGQRLLDDTAEGTCVRNLVVGSSRTLSLSDPLPGVGERSARTLAASKALDVFARFARSALRRLAMNNAIEFDGYAGLYAERLRRGITLGRGSSIDAAFQPSEAMVSRPTEEGDAAWLDDWEDLRRLEWLFNNDRQFLTSKSSRDVLAAQAAQAVAPPPGGATKVRPAPDDGSEPPDRPVVTYITRWPQYSRTVLNELQVLKYINNRFNVTLRVTSLTEPVHAAAELLATTDVLIGSHGEGWTHAMFLKPGAIALQMLPHGWRLPSGALLGGAPVQTLVHLRQGTHLVWTNPHADFSFFRREDFLAGDEEYRQHPDNDDEDTGDEGGWAAPHLPRPHPAWVNANTYADLNHLGPYIDEVMSRAGVQAMTAADVRRHNAARKSARLAALAAAAEEDGDGNVAAAGATLEDDDMEGGEEDE